MADAPRELGFTVAPPAGSLDRYPGIAAMWDPATGSLREGYGLGDFYAAAQAEGLPIVNAATGITNSSSQAYSASVSVSREMAALGQGVLVVSAYNPTHGRSLDGIESFLLKGLNVNISTVEATRLLLEDSVAYNQALAERADTPSLAYTQAWGHSEGAALMTMAMSSDMLSLSVRQQIDLRVLGSPMGNAPEGLHTFRSIWNWNDPVAATFGRTASATGGVEFSPAFIAANQAVPGSYTATRLDFRVDVPAGMTNENHSWQYYLSDPAGRGAFGLVPMNADLASFYSRSYWLKGE